MSTWMKTTISWNDESDKTRDGRYLRREFSYTKFQRTLVLPDDVDKDGISAKVENGVLNIVLPKVKKQETAAHKNIEVQ